MNPKPTFNPKQVLLTGFIFFTAVAWMIFLPVAHLQNTNTPQTANVSNVPISPTPRRRGNTNVAANTTRRVTNTNTTIYTNLPSDYDEDYPSPTPEQTATVRGRVIYEDTGRPVRRATITLLVQRGGGEKSSLTDNNGNFEIKEVKAGAYIPMVIAPGVLNPIAYIDFSRFGERSPDSENELFDDIRKNFQEVVTNGINDTETTILVKRGGAIGGRILYSNGDPAVGVRVELLRKIEGKYVQVVSDLFLASFERSSIGGKTDDRGVYRFAGLPAGEYLVKAVEPAIHSKNDYSYGPSVLQGFMKSLIATFYPDTTEVEKAQTVNLEVGQEVAEINITINDNALHDVKGVVLSKATKEPVRNAKVSINKDDKTFSIFSAEGLIETATDAEGRWVLKEIPNGTYQITVRPPDENYSDYAANVNIPINTATNRPRPTPNKPKLTQVEREITLTNESNEELTFELPLGSSLSGRVAGDKNQDLPISFRVVAKTEKGKEISSYYYYGYQPEASTNPKFTNFVIDKLPAQKVLLQVDGGYGSNSDFYVKSIKINNVETLNQPFQIPEAAEVKNVQILLATDLGKLSGKIKTTDPNKSVAGKRVLLIPADENKWTLTNARRFAVSDENGNFEITAPPGEYFVIQMRETDNFSAIKTDWLRERTKEAEKVTLEPEKTETITLKLP